MQHRMLRGTCLQPTVALLPGVLHGVMADTKGSMALLGPMLPLLSGVAPSSTPDNGPTVGSEHAAR